MERSYHGRRTQVVIRTKRENLARKGIDENKTSTPIYSDEVTPKS